MEQKIPISLRLPKGILRRLEEYAEKEYRTKTNAIEQILDRELPKAEAGEQKK